MTTALDDALDALPTAELERMLYRAYREAARSWAEYHATTDASIRPLLRALAETADYFYDALASALRVRAEDMTS